MCKNSVRGHMVIAAAGFFLGLLLLCLSFWDASRQLSAGRTQELEIQMRELAILEANYIGGQLSGIMSGPEEAEYNPADPETHMLHYSYELYDDTDVQEYGFSVSAPDGGEVKYTYYQPVPDSTLVVAVMLDQSAFNNVSGGYKHICFTLAERILCIFAALLLFLRFELLRRQNRLSAVSRHLRIALNHSACMAFEYDLSRGMICMLGGNAQEKHMLYETGQQESELWEKLIHPNDLSGVLALKEQMISSRRPVSLVVRAHVSDHTGEYRWCRLTFTPVKNTGGHPVQAVGTLADIDEQLNETLSLRRKAERDSLTGLFNREECERRVERLLAESRGETGGVFLLMDMDDFKALNDSMGHISGDAALRTLAGVIRQVFRESDISGRMGGDEFMVWLRDIRGVDVVEWKLSELRTALRFEAHRDPLLPNLLLSIGVVFAQPGDHFLDLYNMADVALYQAKKEGRNRHVYYRRDEESACVNSYVKKSGGREDSDK